ncbi:hypothetical protein BJ742DRAFT_356022 [Cladochytrium replicatum]|nr:hypothetical protein BJ742DRAFT_356022 [Cladochytrium replicatum]
MCLSVHRSRERKRRSLWILCRGRWESIEGVVKEKAEAQQEYTNARDKGTVSALIGIDVNPGQFRVSIGNLPGGAAATMHITFIMEVSSSSENIRIAFPTQRPTALESKPAVVGTDTKLQVEVGVELLSGTIRALSSPSHRNVFVEMGKTVKLSHGPEALADAGASAFGETTVSCARATYSGRPSEDPLEIFVAVDPGSKPAGRKIVECSVMINVHFQTVHGQPSC